MRLGRFVETVCAILMVLLGVIILLIGLLVVEIVQFVLGQPISTMTKALALLYIGGVVSLTVYLIAVKLYNLRQD